MKSWSQCTKERNKSRVCILKEHHLNFKLIIISLHWCYVPCNDIGLSRMLFIFYVFFSYSSSSFFILFGITFNIFFFKWTPCCADSKKVLYKELLWFLSVPIPIYQSFPVKVARVTNDFFSGRISVIISWQIRMDKFFSSSKPVFSKMLGRLVPLHISTSIWDFQHYLRTKWW